MSQTSSFDCHTHGEWLTTAVLWQIDCEEPANLWNEWMWFQNQCSSELSQKPPHHKIFLVLLGQIGCLPITGPVTGKRESSVCLVHWCDVAANIDVGINKIRVSLSRRRRKWLLTGPSHHVSRFDQQDSKSFPIFILLAKLLNEPFTTQKVNFKKGNIFRYSANSQPKSPQECL